MDTQKTPNRLSTAIQGTVGNGLPIQNRKWAGRRVVRYHQLLFIYNFLSLNLMASWPSLCETWWLKPRPHLINFSSYTPFPYPCTQFSGFQDSLSALGDLPRLPQTKRKEMIGISSHGSYPAEKDYPNNF